MPHSHKDKALFVHDKDHVHDFVTNTLEYLGYETHLADSIENAKDKILAHSFKLIVSEKVLTNGTGFQILNFVRQMGNTPFVFIAQEYSPEDKEGQDLLNFISISRPFRELDLLTSIEGFLKRQWSGDIVLNGAHHIDVNDELSIIDIDEFITGREIKYDIFINIGEKKFIKLAHGNDSLTEDQVEKLKTKGVTSLYMKKNDFQDYIATTVSLIKHMPKFKISASRKSLFIKQTSKMVTESILAKDIEAEAIQHAKTVVESTINMLVGCDEILLTLEFLKNTHKNVFSHSMSVALYSVIIARNMKMNSYISLAHLAAGGMFHDVGMAKVPAAVQEIPTEDLSPSEIKLWEAHTTYGSEMIRAINGIPEEVMMIIEQHHNSPTNPFVDPLSKIVKVADDFCEFMANRIPSLVNVMAALEMMEGANAHRYDPECVAALKMCFTKKRIQAA